MKAVLNAVMAAIVGHRADVIVTDEMPHDPLLDLLVDGKPVSDAKMWVTCTFAGNFIQKGIALQQVYAADNYRKSGGVPRTNAVRKLVLDSVADEVGAAL